jgi:hypothetical protein
MSYRLPLTRRRTEFGRFQLALPGGIHRVHLDLDFDLGIRVGLGEKGRE